MMSSRQDVNGRKMVLVPVSVWEQMKQLHHAKAKHDTMELTKKHEDAVVYKAFSNMRDTLQMDEKDEIKADKHSEALNDFTMLRNKITIPLRHYLHPASHK